MIIVTFSIKGVWLYGVTQRIISRVTFYCDMQCFQILYHYEMLVSRVAAFMLPYSDKLVKINKKYK